MLSAWEEDLLRAQIPWPLTQGALVSENLHAVGQPDSYWDLSLEHALDREMTHV